MKHVAPRLYIPRAALQRVVAFSPPLICPFDLSTRLRKTDRLISLFAIASNLSSYTTSSQPEQYKVPSKISKAISCPDLRKCCLWQSLEYST